MVVQDIFIALMDDEQIQIYGEKACQILWQPSLMIYVINLNIQVAWVAVIGAVKCSWNRKEEKCYVHYCWYFQSKKLHNY